MVILTAAVSNVVYLFIKHWCFYYFSSPFLTMMSWIIVPSSDLCCHNNLSTETVMTGRVQYRIVCIVLAGLAKRSVLHNKLKYHENNDV